MAQINRRKIISTKTPKSTQQIKYGNTQETHNK
jgi:hypothetical protein